MDWTAFVSGLIGAGFGSTLVGILLATWLNHTLTVERAKAEEKRQLLQKRREASAAVADILGEWVRPTYTGTFSDEDRWRLQTTYWKNILWLDKELLDVLLPVLENKEGAVGSNEVIVQARKVLLGLSEPDIRWNQLNNWLPESTTADPERKKERAPVR